MKQQKGILWMFVTMGLLGLLLPCAYADNATGWEGNLYNFTNLSSRNDVTGFLEFGQIVSFGWFGRLMLLTLFVIMFMSMSSFRPSIRLASGSFLCMIIAVIMRVLNILPDTDMFICIVLCVGSILIILFED